MIVNLVDKTIQGDFFPYNFDMANSETLQTQTIIHFVIQSSLAFSMGFKNPLLNGGSKK